MSIKSFVKTIGEAVMLVSPTPRITDIAPPRQVWVAESTRDAVATGVDAPRICDELLGEF